VITVKKTFLEVIPAFLGRIHQEDHGRTRDFKFHGQRKEQKSALLFSGRGAGLKGRPSHVERRLLLAAMPACLPGKADMQSKPLILCEILPRISR
jgi:hypothetical protein